MIAVVLVVGAAAIPGHATTECWNSMEGPYYLYPAPGVGTVSVVGVSGCAWASIGTPVMSNHIYVWVCLTYDSTYCSDTLGSGGLVATGASNNLGTGENPLRTTEAPAYCRDGQQRWKSKVDVAAQNDVFGPSVVGYLAYFHYATNCVVPFGSSSTVETDYYSALRGTLAMTDTLRACAVERDKLVLAEAVSFAKDGAYKSQAALFSEGLVSSASTAYWRISSPQGTEVSPSYTLEKVNPFC